jgi:hypothetical protein
LEGATVLLNYIIDEADVCVNNIILELEGTVELQVFQGFTDFTIEGSCIF